MSTVTFIHQIEKVTLKNDVKSIYEERIVDGAKGILIKYYNKNGSNVERITIWGNNDEYTMKTSKDDVVDEKK